MFHLLWLVFLQWIPWLFLGGLVLVSLSRDTLRLGGLIDLGYHSKHRKEKRIPRHLNGIVDFLRCCIHITAAFGSGPPCSLGYPAPEFWSWPDWEFHGLSL